MLSRELLLLIITIEDQLESRKPEIGCFFVAIPFYVSSLQSQSVLTLGLLVRQLSQLSSSDHSTAAM